jgi:hypothetical protein
MGIITLILGSGFLIFAGIAGFIIFIGIIILIVYFYRNWDTIFKKTETVVPSPSPSPDSSSRSHTPTKTTNPINSLPLPLVGGSSVSSYVNDLQMYAEQLKNRLLIPDYKSDYLESIRNLLFQYCPDISETFPLDLDMSGGDIPPQLAMLLDNLDKLSQLANESMSELFGKNQTIINEFS